MSDRDPQGSPPLAGCTWYKYIICFLQDLRPPDGMGRRKERYLKLKAIIYFLINQVLYWKDPLGVLLICLDTQEAQKIILNYHKNLCGGHHFWKTTNYKILRAGYY
jgi:hypothetical protein